jgi:hypothetical protein
MAMPEPVWSSVSDLTISLNEWEAFSKCNRSCLLTKTDRRRQNRPNNSRRAQARKHLEQHTTRQTEAVGRHWADRVECLNERALGSIRCGIVGCVVGADAIFPGLLVGQDARDAELVGVVELAADCHCGSVVLGFGQTEEGEDAAEAGEDG